MWNYGCTGDAGLDRSSVYLESSLHLVGTQSGSVSALWTSFRPNRYRGFHIGRRCYDFVFLRCAGNGIWPDCSRDSRHLSTILFCHHHQPSGLLDAGAMVLACGESSGKSLCSQQPVLICSSYLWLLSSKISGYGENYASRYAGRSINSMWLAVVCRLQIWSPDRPSTVTFPWPRRTR